MNFPIVCLFTFVLFVYSQQSIYRYGREDEEVMGLKFCNEAIIALKQILPITSEDETITPLQVRPLSSSKERHRSDESKCLLEKYFFRMGNRMEYVEE